MPRPQGRGKIRFFAIFSLISVIFRMSVARRNMHDRVRKFGMPIPRILGAAGVVAYLLAMCLPAIDTKGYDRSYLLPGWEVTYVCGLFSFAPSMDLGERAPFIVGTLANLLFLVCAILFLVGRFWRRPWPQDVVICWISGVCLVLAVVSISIAGKVLDGLLFGAYLWISSPMLVFAGSLIECWRRRKGRT